MCGSCSDGSHSGRRRWTSSHLIALALVLSLIVLGGVGLAFRFDGGSKNTVLNCGSAVSDSRGYEAVVTRDLRSRPLLFADTEAFARQLLTQGESDCAPARRTIISAESSLSTICPACTGMLRQALGAAAAA